MLHRGSAQLRAAGFSARSAFLTSPTFGGLSWLAHSTLQSGIKVDGQRRYDQLVAEYYEKGKALSTAAAFEIDDVIDPAQTRHVLTQTLARTRS